MHHTLRHCAGPFPIVVSLERDTRDRGLPLRFLELAAFFVATTLPLVHSKGWNTESWAAKVD